MKILIVNVTFRVLMVPSDLSDFITTSCSSGTRSFTYYSKTKETLCILQTAASAKQRLTESTILKEFKDSIWFLLS